MNKTRKLALCALMISLALALSYVERFIPLQLLIPLPGIKLGLANIVTLIAIYLLGPVNALAIVVCRCFLGSLFGGGITALMFSLTGGILSLVVMSLARNLPCLSIYGVSILGAAAHNVGQICMAVLLMQSHYVAAYLPYLLLAGIAAGLFTGLCARFLIQRLEKLGA